MIGFLTGHSIGTRLVLLLWLWLRTQWLSASCLVASSHARGWIQSMQVSWTFRICLVVHLPTISRIIEPSAMITASMYKFRRLASWKPVPRIEITLQIVWTLPRWSMILAYLYACFQIISPALAYQVRLMATIMSFKYSKCLESDVESCPIWNFLC